MEPAFEASQNLTAGKWQGLGGGVDMRVLFANRTRDHVYNAAELYRI